MFSDLAHNMFDHFLDCIRVITVLVPGAKHGIDYETTPGHLQGCKAFDSLVGRPYTVPFWSLVIVHDHDVYAEHNGLGFLQFEPPDKELLEKTAEKIDSGPPKRTEESFHGMGGEHRIGWRLNGLGVTGVFAQLVEVDEVATRSIHKKTKDLFENLADGLPFAAFSKGAEESVKVRKQSDPRQIPYKQAQPAAAAQCFTCRRHIINSVFGTLITCDRILHVNLPPIGLTLWNPSWPTFSPQYQKLNPLGGIYFCHESLDLGISLPYEGRPISMQPRREPDLFFFSNIWIMSTADSIGPFCVMLVDFRIIQRRHIEARATIPRVVKIIRAGKMNFALDRYLL